MLSPMRLPTVTQDLGPRLTAMVIVTGLLAFSSMIMRAYVRITRRNWGIDDWNMAIACVSVQRDPLMPVELTRPATSLCPDWFWGRRIVLWYWCKRRTLHDI